MVIKEFLLEFRKTKDVRRVAAGARFEAVGVQRQGVPPLATGKLENCGAMSIAMHACPPRGTIS